MVGGWAHGGRGRRRLRAPTFLYVPAALIASTCTRASSRSDADEAMARATDRCIFCPQAGSEPPQRLALFLAGRGGKGSTRGDEPPAAQCCFRNHTQKTCSGIPKRRGRAQRGRGRTASPRSRHRVVALGPTPSRSEVVGRTIPPSHGAHRQLRQLEGERRTRGDAISATRFSSSRGVAATANAVKRRAWQKVALKNLATRRPYEASSKQNSAANVASVLPAE